MLLATTLWGAAPATGGADIGVLRDSVQAMEPVLQASPDRTTEIDTAGGLGSYLAYAAEQSPALRSAFYRFKAAVERTGYAGALTDPMLSYTHMFEAVETRVGPQNWRAGLRQSFPWFGTLGAEKSAAAHAAQAVLGEFETERLRLFYRVKAAYYDYYLLGRELAITRENLELVKFWESVARSKYRVALTTHPDVIKAQVALGELEDQVLRLEDLMRPAATRLRSEVNLPEPLELPVPEEIRISERALDFDAVMERALSAHPDLLAARARIERDRAVSRLAVKRTRPQFALGVEYIATGEALNPLVDESGKDPWMVTASVTLPLWLGKNAARRREAEAALRQTEYALEDARNRMTVLVTSTLTEHADALRKVRLYRDGLIPKAQQSLDAEYTAYQAGETDFLNVLDAQRRFLDFQLRYEHAVSDLALHIAELEMLCVGPLEPYYSHSPGSNTYGSAPEDQAP